MVKEQSRQKRAFKDTYSNMCIFGELLLSMILISFCHNFVFPEIYLTPANNQLFQFLHYNVFNCIILKIYLSCCFSDMFEMLWLYRWVWEKCPNMTRVRQSRNGSGMHHTMWVELHIKWLQLFLWCLCNQINFVLFVLHFFLYIYIYELCLLYFYPRHGMKCFPFSELKE